MPHNCVLQTLWLRSFNHTRQRECRGKRGSCPIPCLCLAAAARPASTVVGGPRKPSGSKLGLGVKKLDAKVSGRRACMLLRLVQYG